MKKVSIILIVSILILFLCSCSSEPIEPRNDNSMYNITEIQSNNLFYVDTETNVMYWYSAHGYAGGLDIMIDENGNPKLAN